MLYSNQELLEPKKFKEQRPLCKTFPCKQRNTNATVRDAACWRTSTSKSPQSEPACRQYSCVPALRRLYSLASTCWSCALSHHHATGERDSIAVKCERPALCMCCRVGHVAQRDASVHSEIASRIATDTSDVRVECMNVKPEH